MKITGKLAEKGFHTFDAEAQSHQGHKIPHTWIVVADAHKAHIYRRVAANLELIADAEFDGTNAEAFDGHFFKNSAGREKHDPDSRDRKQHHGDLAFIHGLAEWLDMADNENVVDRLVLVADPHTLGKIRSSLTQKLQNRVTAELDKDLTSLSLKDVEKHLSHILVA